MKTILVPTDLSPITAYALDVAVDLARTSQAEIVLLHTVLYGLIPQPAVDYTPEFSAIMAENYELSRKNAEESLRELAANPKYAGVVITPKLGNSLDGLVHSIHGQPADLIVLASKGASGLMEWLEGSTAELIVRHATCPVLVIKQPIEHFLPANVICAVDLDEKLKEPHPYPFSLANQGLHQFVYVLTPADSRQPEDIRQWIGEYVLAQGIDQYHLKISHDRTISSGILNYAEEMKADLIVIYTHGHKGWQHWIKGSVAEDVLNHANQAVLIMRV